MSIIDTHTPAQDPRFSVRMPVVARRAKCDVCGWESEPRKQSHRAAIKLLGEHMNTAHPRPSNTDRDFGVFDNGSGLVVIFPETDAAVLWASRNPEALPIPYPNRGAVFKLGSPEFTAAITAIEEAGMAARYTGVE